MRGDAQASGNQDRVVANGEIRMMNELLMRVLSGTPLSPTFTWPCARGRANHFRPYGLLILLPLTGAAAVRGGAAWAAAAHNLLAAEGP
jgi:hypothetical protein